MHSHTNSARSTSDLKPEAQIRIYKRAESAVFSKTKEGFGGLSNMAAGFPIHVNGVRILTSEALYQACRFPHLPHVQRLIIGQLSPMTAKMKSKPYRKDSRPDWDRVRVKVMRWCLRVKLAQNWSDFSRLLLATGDRAIVEESRKDDFWGAKVVEADTLVGTNALGRLLMELREEIKQGNIDQLKRVEPLPLADFLLFGETIAVVEARSLKSGAATHPSATGEHGATQVRHRPELGRVAPHVGHPSLFDRKDTLGASEAMGASIVDTLQRYPEYKACGLPWLGRVPAHWNEQRAKYFLREVDERSQTGKEELMSVSHLTGVTPRREKTQGVQA
jgi:type I restriction enzyme S subunit